MSMSGPVIVGVVALLLAMSGFSLSNLFVTAMIGEINRKSDDKNAISYFGYHPSKAIFIFREYRRLYPSGRFHIYAIGGMVLAFVGVVTAFIIMVTVPGLIPSR